MPSNFEAFASALRLLCRRHRVVLAAEAPGTLGVRDAEGGDDPLHGLVDRTQGPPSDPAAPQSTVPVHFATEFAASRHDGFLGSASSQAQAHEVMRFFPGAVLVPIGPPGQERGWAIVQPA